MTEPATHYTGSKGRVEIATMNGKHAAMAAAKLRREQPDRMAEIAALEAHAARMEIEHGNADSDVNPRAVIGGNMPPEEIPADAHALSGWDAIKAHMDDLLSEAGNWADGVELISQEQADSVGNLRSMLQQAVKVADDARIAEKKPFDDAIAEIQDRFNAYIAPLKNRSPGSVSKAIAALGNLLTGWLAKQEKERREREAAAAKEAAAAAAEALAAREDAKVSTDIAAQDRAEDTLANAEALLRQAKGVSRERVQAGGGDGLRAQTLRTYWVHQTTDYNALLKHMMARDPDTLRAALDDFARREIARGIRDLPGCTITEQKKVA